MSVVSTASGREIDLGRLEIDHTSITVRDIATHLSRINRFNGATTFPYSVAQHSVLVVRIVEHMKGSPIEAFIALLHDAHEAYMGDITRPVYRALNIGNGCHAVDFLRQRLDRAISRAFGIDLEMPCAVVAAADNQALATEWRDLMPGPLPKGYSQYGVAPWAVKPMPADKAEQAFLEAFHRLDIGSGRTVRREA
jgi:hypothetical protein